nr:MAG TPA: hypothetical protein [Caudoviricetes sp.]
MLLSHGIALEQLKNCLSAQLFRTSSFIPIWRIFE